LATGLIFLLFDGSWEGAFKCKKKKETKINIIISFVCWCFCGIGNITSELKNK